MLLIKGVNTMFIIVFAMLLIVATMIFIVFAKIGNVLKHLKYVWVKCYIISKKRGCSEIVFRHTLLYLL